MLSVTYNSIGEKYLDQFNACSASSVLTFIFTICIQSSNLAFFPVLTFLCINAWREKTSEGQQDLLKYAQFGMERGMRILLHFNENCECCYFFH